MSRMPGVNQGVVLPPPPLKYDASDQRETRRLLQEALRRLLQWDTVTNVPGNVESLSGLSGASDGLPYFTGAEEFALTTLTTFGRLLIAATDAQAGRTALGFGFNGLRTTLTLNTASLAADATEAGTLAMSTGTAALLNITADQPCWVRFYSTSAGRAVDSARAITERGTPGTGLLAEFVFDSAGQMISVSPVATLMNDDAPAAKNVYYSVQNKSGVTTAIQIIPLILPLEIP